MSNVIAPTAVALLDEDEELLMEQIVLWVVRQIDGRICIEPSTDGKVEFRIRKKMTAYGVGIEINDRRAYPFPDGPVNLFPGDTFNAHIKVDLLEQSGGGVCGPLEISYYSPENKYQQKPIQ